MPEYVIEMNHIRKEFPGIVANDDITLKLRKGEIHALLGENVAGKDVYKRQYMRSLRIMSTNCMNARRRMWKRFSQDAETGRRRELYLADALLTVKARNANILRNGMALM